MTKDLNVFKTKLEEEKTVLINELKAVGVVKDNRNPTDWQAVPTETDILEADPNEVADRIGSYEGNNALVNELEKRLAEVDAALTKIHSGNFGTCTVCNKEIEDDRLHANPAAPTCKEHMNG